MRLVESMTLSLSRTDAQCQTSIILGTLQAKPLAQLRALAITMTCPETKILNVNSISWQ